MQPSLTKKEYKMTRLTMKQIKIDAAKRRAALLKELQDKDLTITELAIIHGMTQQAMGVMIRKARKDIGDKK